MPKLPRVTGKEVLSALKRYGLEVIYIKGSHHYLRRPNGSRLVTVPVHSGEVIPPKTLQSIFEQTGLSVDEFIELL
jgi:predicted RNA binding protein YcfA (HicA-like mRNA interferase family)